MKRKHWVILLAAGWIPAFPFSLQAQQLPYAPAIPDLSGAASAEQASVPVAAFALEPTVGMPAAPAAEALPAWPPDSGGLFGYGQQDLSKSLSPSQKFSRAMKQAIFPGIVGSAAAAGLGMATDRRVDRDYGMGGMGFVRRWGSAFGQNAVGQFVGDFALASAFHQDPRYHPDKKKGFGHRMGHALAAVVVTHSDSGKSEFNSSQLIGIAAAAGASTAWHHSSDRSGKYFAERFAYGVSFSAGYKVISEFLFYRNEPRN